MCVSFGIIILAIIFIMDLSTPFGVADGMFYLIAVILTLFFQESFYVFIVGAITTLLIVLGFYFSHDWGNMLVVGLINRLYSIILIWVTVFLIYRFKETLSNRKLCN